MKRQLKPVRGYLSPLTLITCQGHGESFSKQEFYSFFFNSVHFQYPVFIVYLTQEVKKLE